MSKAVVFGATGYAGSHIVDELLTAGHEVVAVARNTDKVAPREGLSVVQGSVTDAAVVERVTQGADVIVSALPAATDEITLPSAVQALLSAAARVNARLGVVGGATTLRVSEGGPKVAEVVEFPAEFQGVITAHADALNALEASDDSIDWFYFSPAAEFGPQNPGTRTGTYRVGSTVLLNDENGSSRLSGADYAIAFVDEITSPKHHRAQIHAAY
ncbi:NAD(P)-dependent oxidoreductase [Curtobacterium citreum]|uniref:NAD(P)H-binding protein n=1 Tax=Curtobacterium citreum TaxID=2036 RepID=A0ABU8Y6L1_9MICO